jgi:hypothetical protein
MLGTDAAVAAYEEQRLELQAERNVRDTRQRAELVNSQIPERTTKLPKTGYKVGRGRAADVHAPETSRDDNDASPDPLR